MHRMRKERGTALVIALVILVAVTLLAVAAVQTSVMEMRMAANDETSMQIFQEAESAIDVGISKIDEYRAKIGGVGSPAVTLNDTANNIRDIQNAQPEIFENMDPASGETDTLVVTMRKIAECLPPPRIRSATSIKEYTRHDYMVRSEVDRSGSGEGKVELEQGFVYLAPGAGC